MADKEKDVAEKLLAGMRKIWGKGRCQMCGSDNRETDFFHCGYCSIQICSDCYNMTDDKEVICLDCIEARGLTSDDLQF